MRTAGFLVVVLATAREASAQHHHHGAPGGPAPRPFRASVTAIAAHFDTGFYAGDYEGLGFGFGWQHGRGSVHATMPFYRLEENGLTEWGQGDVVVAADHAVVARPRWRAGVALGMSLPTAQDPLRFGMGHVMTMPSSWISGHRGRVAGGVAIGWCGALARAEDHDHGVRPLVEPMNTSELTAEVRAEARAWRQLHAGARLEGALPVGVDGTARAIASVGARWSSGRVDTGAQLQVGLAGDPFTIRGLWETAVRF